MGDEKILIIDDRRENLLFLADSVLRPEGYQVITAMDGKQGLDKALAEKPDLIITDLKMPRLSGLELMAALRKANSNTPVILTTFYGSEQAAIEAFRMGAKDYIIKPYKVKDMLEAVERALIELRLRRETADLQAGIEFTQHLEERVRQLHSLCGIGKAVTAMHDPDEVMRTVVEAAIHLTDAGTGQLFLVNPLTRQLEVRAVRGPSDSRATLLQQAGADQTAMQVAETGKAVISEPSSGGRAKVPRLAVPIRFNQEVIGVVGVDAKPNFSFNDSDRYQMGILADFSAVALTNAQAIGGLKRRAESRSGQSGTPPGRAARGAAAPDLSECIAEAQKLSRELRSLATAAQVLADELQVSSRSD